MCLFPGIRQAVLLLQSCYLLQMQSFTKGNMLAAEGNVIVVTAGFRVGVFGFLRAHSVNLKGNYGKNYFIGLGFFLTVVLFMCCATAVFASLNDGY